MNMANENNYDDEAPARNNFSFQQILGKQIPNGNLNEKQFPKRDMDHIIRHDITFGNTEQQKINFKVENVPSKNNINKAPIDDTTNLFQDIIKEVISWKSKNEINLYKQNSPITKTNKCYQNESQNFMTDQARKYQNTELRAQPKNYLSFADLSRELGVKNERLNSFPIHEHYAEMSKPCLNFSKESNDLVTTEFKINVSKTAGAFQYSKANHSEMDLRDFKPAFVSTPKRRHLNGNSPTQSLLQNKTNMSYASQVIRSRRNRLNKQYKTNKSKITQTTLSTTKDVKQRSMSARFLNAINDSCMILVKSVKEIFTSKKDNKKNKNSNSGDSDKNYETDSCSYSFTNYLRKRDAVLANEDTKTVNMEYEESSYIYRDSCRTCKDTIVLQHKMATDENLQQTIKRLKIGVNLYGCNFKVVNETHNVKYKIEKNYVIIIILKISDRHCLLQKISKTMWPRNRYMTPNILYNLYRKLVINGGYQKKFPEKH